METHEIWQQHPGENPTKLSFTYIQRRHTIFELTEKINHGLLFYGEHI